MNDMPPVLWMALAVAADAGLVEILAFSTDRAAARAKAVERRGEGPILVVELLHGDTAETVRTVRRWLLDAGVGADVVEEVARDVFREVAALWSTRSVDPSTTPDGV
jgi:hypothetical protein